MEKEAMSSIAKILLDIGIPAHLKGFYFIQKALVDALDGKIGLKPIMKLYDFLAQEDGKTPARVERTQTPSLPGTAA